MAKPITLGELEFILEKHTRRIQSIVDSGAARTKKELSGFSEQLARLKELQSEGLTEKQALWQMNIEEQLQKLRPDVREDKPENDLSAIEKEFLEKLGLSIDSPKVLSVMQSTRNPTERMVGYAKLVELGSQEKGTPNNSSVNPSMMMPSTPSSGMSSPSLDEQYKKEMKEMGFRRGDVKAQMDLLLKYRKLAKENNLEFNY